MLEYYSACGGVGTHPAADDGFAPKLPLPPAAPEGDRDHRVVVSAVPNRRPVILASASIAVLGGDRLVVVLETGEGGAAFTSPVTIVRGGRP